MLSNEEGKEFDEDGKTALSGNLNTSLLEKLNALDYYKQSHLKSLANDFGTDVVYPMIREMGCGIRDSLSTYVEHITIQIKNSITNRVSDSRLMTRPERQSNGLRLLATGGGAFNTFLIERLKENLNELNIEVIIPEENLVKYKEALIMALIGILRWRQEYNVLSSVTGAKRDSIGGALWNGQEA